jgi:hypothetical protein
MLLAVVASVQIGRERWWPGTALRRSVGLRLLLLGLNAFAVLVLPVVLDSVGPGYTEGYDAGYADVAPVRPGLMDRGAWVRNVFAYDAQGRPLTGVQLFDQDGRPLAVSTGVEEWSDSGRAEVVYPWLSGSDGRPVFNVFPLPVRSQGSYDDSAHPQAWSSTRPPRLPAAPLVAVPPAALPSSGPSGAASPSAQPSAQASAQPSAKPSPRP